MNGPPVEVRLPKRAKDPVTARALWEAAELTGVTCEFGARLRRSPPPAPGHAQRRRRTRTTNSTAVISKPSGGCGRLSIPMPSSRSISCPSPSTKK